MARAKDHGRHKPAPYTHLIAAELPADIAVAADSALRNQTTEALDMLSQRLGFRWHFAPRSEAEIYIHWVAGVEYMHVGTNGETYLPLSPRYDGVIRIRIRDAATIAHEVLHVLGFEHFETGIMRANHVIRLSDGITDEQIHRAMLIRMAAASRYHAVPAETGLQATNRHQH